MSILTYDNNSFLKDGAKHTVLSGAMHYFRIPREYWHDRLEKLKACGFNTVETYTCWNLHEPSEGKFDFTGMLDIAEYAREAQSLGLDMIVRPGPYICAEWEFGGLPSWLLGYKDMQIRCNDALFISKVKRYYTALFDELRPMLASNGGNIVMVQIENEYGSYGDDKDYLRAVEQIYVELGVDVLLFTSDEPEKWTLAGGTLPNRLCVANFGSDVKNKLAVLKSYRPNQPMMCGEYWCGWFDHWYEKHHVRPADEIASLFDEMLSSGASMNFYMFHGGTNFGFMAGSNFDGVFQPTVTSYDYNALLSEAGDLTPAYFAVREICEKRFGKLPPLTVKNTKKAKYGKVKLTESAHILDAARLMSNPVMTAAPLCQEDIGQSYGFTIYSTDVTSGVSGLELLSDEIHDRAIFYLDGKRIGQKERTRRDDKIVFDIADGETAHLDILVENMGRINYGPLMPDRKGLTGVRFGVKQKHFGWAITPLEMTAEELKKICYRPNAGGASDASFMRGHFTVDEAADTFVKLDGFHHGFVTVNGFNLGRYYNDAGPQRTLYLPAPMLRKGENEIVVFETDSSETNEIELTDTPELG